MSSKEVVISLENVVKILLKDLFRWTQKEQNEFAAGIRILLYSPLGGVGYH
jgi:hypothetical protein